jgi:hypothetical protein
MANGFWKDCEGHTRRDMLKIGSAGLLGLTLPQLLQYEAAAKAADGGMKAKAKNVILVWLPGGPATIDMWDIKTEAPAEIRGEFKPIKTSADGIEISEHLPKTAQQIDKCTIVRSLYHGIPSHGLAAVWMTTGNKPSPALQYPSLGSLCSKLLPTDVGVPPYVSFSDIRNGSIGGAGYLGTAYNPFGVEGVGAGGRGGAGNLRVRGITLPTGFTLEELENRDKLVEGFDQSFKALDKSSDLADGMDAFHKQALEILRSDKTKTAFNLQAESQATRDLYGSTPMSQAALAARRLVEAGVRFVTISGGGWDTHNQNFVTLKDRNLPMLDVVLSALIKDLSDRGLLDSTIVYCAGEFGRTPKINQRAGRDHWARSMAVLLAGGGFKKGFVLGSTDSQGMQPHTDPCTPDDVAATVFHNLGVNPQHELPTASGRKIRLFREGKVISKILA